MSRDAEKIQYKKLKDFIRRINQQDMVQEDDEETKEIVQAREDQIPRLPESKEKCTVTMPGGEVHEIPLYQPVIGPKALDGGVLTKKTGMFTYDPGFTSTASCVS